MDTVDAQKTLGQPLSAAETLEVQAKVVAPGPPLTLALVTMALAMMTMTAPAMGETAGAGPAVASMRGSLR